MFGVVSLLDPEHYRKVEALWAELDHAFGLKGVYVTPWPHLSYQVAAGYDLERLQPVLERFAASHAPLQVQTAGLGIFTGPRPVLYLPVVRTPELSRFHAELVAEVSPYAKEHQAYYNPPHWVPHITVGFGDLTPASLGGAVTYLAERTLSWTITLANVSLGVVAPEGQVIHSRFDLSG